MSKFQYYLEAVKKAPNDDHVPKHAIEAIKNARDDEQAVSIASQYFKDVDDAEAFVDKVRSFDEAADPKKYTLVWTRKGKDRSTTGTLEEITQYFSYELLKGNSYNRKIPLKPKNINALVKAINMSIDETQGGYDRPYVSLGEPTEEKPVTESSKGKVSVMVTLSDEDKDLGVIDISSEEANHFLKTHGFEAKLLLTKAQIEKFKIDEDDFIYIYEK